jgi:hypothetical protein
MYLTHAPHTQHNVYRPDYYDDQYSHDARQQQWFQPTRVQAQPAQPTANACTTSYPSTSYGGVAYGGVTYASAPLLVLVLGNLVSMSLCYIFL